MILKEASRECVKRCVELVAKLVDPLSTLGAILCLVSVDTTKRYAGVSGELVQGSVLDIGAGGRSILTSKRPCTISVDIKFAHGVDIVASASSLPFRENVFTNVVCVDTIEHLPRDFRERALLEMIRVAEKKVIVHSPLEDGKNFVGGKYDRLFDDWYKGIYKHAELFTEEHIRNVEPHPKLFLTLEFRIKGTHNAQLWLNYMCSDFLPTNFKAGNKMISWMRFLLNKSKNRDPPYWGGICVYQKTD